MQELKIDNYIQRGPSKLLVGQKVHFGQPNIIQAQKKEMLGQGRWVHI